MNVSTETRSPQSSVRESSFATSAPRATDTMKCWVRGGVRRLPGHGALSGAEDSPDTDAQFQLLSDDVLRHLSAQFLKL